MHFRGSAILSFKPELVSPSDTFGNIASQISRIFRVVESDLHWHGICTDVDAVSKPIAGSLMNLNVTLTRECRRLLMVKELRAKFSDHLFTPQACPTQQPA